MHEGSGPENRPRIRRYDPVWETVEEIFGPVRVVEAWLRECHGTTLTHHRAALQEFAAHVQVGPALAVQILAFP
ncbi:MAG: hypothetical protein JO161_02520 [Planctomycetaceae bacterium]|nr:hypothetical protein [Planctomycetaceae bacterium]